MTMSYPSYGYPATTPTMAYRPDEVRSMIALARQRIDFHAEQIDVVSEGLAEIVRSHEQIVSHYRTLIDSDRALIERLTGYAQGGRMVDAQLPLAVYDAAMPPLPDAQKDALLGLFVSPGDMKPIADPNPQFNGRSKREIVESAAPIPQSVVSVVHFEAGEPLPEEALPGHMQREPRSAAELERAKAQAAAAPSAVAVAVDEAPADAASTQVEGGLSEADIKGA